MAQRLLRIIVPSDDRDRLRRIVEEEGEEIVWEAPGGQGLTAADVVVPAEGNDPLLDALEAAFRDRQGYRLVLLPLAATMPRPEEEEPGGGRDAEADEEDGEAGSPKPTSPPEPEAEAREAVDRAAPEDAGPGEEGEGALPPEAPSAPSARGPEEAEGEEGAPARISREELYSHITDIGGLTGYHLAMVALSAVVASVGLLRDSSAVVVGAMVIAPLLGPNMALALATTLGDLPLAKEAARTGLTGIAVAFVISVAWGLGAEVDPTGRELTRVTQVGYSEIALALAAGAAGVLSVTRGTATALVGVMVAVALLPPLVAAGLLLGSGFRAGAMGAVTVVAANVICVNLAGVLTFLAQGVRPRTWWEEDRARRSIRVALVFWALLFLGLVFIVHQLRGS